MHGSAPWKTEERIVGLPRLLVLSVLLTWKVLFFEQDCQTGQDCRARNRFVLRNRPSLPVWLRPSGRAVFSVVKLFHLHKVLCQEHRRGRGQSGWLGSNQRFPAPEAGGLAIFPTPRGSAQRESNPHVHHGKARGCHYIMGTATVAELSKRPRAPGGGRTHVTALRERCLAS